jgi:hypothetical protein
MRQRQLIFHSRLLGPILRRFIFGDGVVLRGEKFRARTDPLLVV